MSTPIAERLRDEADLIAGEHGNPASVAVLEAAADRIEELEAEQELLSCELIEARNPGIESDPKWIATKAKRLGTSAEDTP